MAQSLLLIPGFFARGKTPTIGSPDNLPSVKIIAKTDLTIT